MNVNNNNKYVVFCSCASFVTCIALQMRNAINALVFVVYLCIYVVDVLQLKSSHQFIVMCISAKRDTFMRTFRICVCSNF